MLNKTPPTPWCIYTRSRACQARDRISPREKARKGVCLGFSRNIYQKPLSFFFAIAHPPAELTIGVEGGGGAKRMEKRAVKKQHARSPTNKILTSVPVGYLQTKRWRGGGGRTWRESIWGRGREEKRRERRRRRRRRSGGKEGEGKRITRGKDRNIREHSGERRKGVEAAKKIGRGGRRQRRNAEKWNRSSVRRSTPCETSANVHGPRHPPLLHPCGGSRDARRDAQATGGGRGDNVQEATTQWCAYACTYAQMSD